MRRRAALFALAVTAIGWPIGAAPDPAPAAASPAVAPKAAIRPAPAPPHPTVDEAIASAPPVLPAASKAPAPVRTRTPPRSLMIDDSCRLACSQNYYFCAASEPGDCGGSFSQCSAACDAPNLAASVPDLAP